MLKGLVLFAFGWALVLGGGFMANRIQTADGVKVEDVRFKGASGTPMSALLYTPATATAAHPAPGVLAVHGYINSRETQDGFAIEFARRGYVVLAIDQTGHGYSGGFVGSNGFGGPDGLAYLRGLKIVDASNIGLEGHSMGGWAILAAAKAMPDGYKAMVLEGSAPGVRVAPTAPPFSEPGTPQWPRNVGVVFSQYDEFAPLMWGVDRAADVGQAARLKAMFATGSAVLPYKLYGDLASGTGRQLYTPLTTHPGDHASTESIGDAVDWFGKTLVGGHARPLSDQIWMGKEAGTLAALIGFVIVMLGTFSILIELPLLSSLRQATNRIETSRGGRWWTVFLVSVLVPVISFYPFMLIGMTQLPPTHLLPQSITTQLAVWALLNAAIILVVGMFVGGSKPAFTVRWVASIVVAAVTVAMGYFSVHVIGHLFNVDARIWVVALKQLSPRQMHIFLVYLPAFTIFFIVALRAMHARLMVRRESAAAQYMTSLMALTLGWVLFLAAQYAPLFLQGHLLVPAEALNAIISIQFLPLMAIVAIIATFTWRRTNSYLPGALICGLFVTWYVVAGTATQFAG
jgi:pimeloyl-ACP methyl ester carboxylesterase